jgi:hypothetical protein
MKPIIRKEASLEFHSKIVQSAFETLEKNSDKYFPFQSCINCKNFSEPDEKCLKYNMRPPVRVLVFGCNDYEDVGDIPF